MFGKDYIKMYACFVIITRIWCQKIPLGKFATVQNGIKELSKASAFETGTKSNRIHFTTQSVVDGKYSLT